MNNRMARDTCQNKNNRASGVGDFASRVEVFAAGIRVLCIRGRVFLHQG